MQNKKRIWLIASAVVLLFATNAFANDPDSWIVDPTLMYLTQNTNNNGSQDNISRLVGDLKLGYELSSPIYIGAIYAIDNSTYNPGGTTENYSSYGPTAGLVMNNFYLLLSYFISSQFAVSTGAKYTNGNGYQVALGWKVPVSSSVDIVPELDYDSMSYSKLTTSGVTVSTKYDYSTIVPEISFWIRF